MTEIVFIGVGSNIDPEHNVPAALNLLSESVQVTGISRCFKTQPIARPEQSMYINCVWKVETDMDADELKSKLHNIESKLGRVRTEDKYASRTIDLDILVYGKQVLDDDIETRTFLQAGLSDLDSGFPVPETADTLQVDETMSAALKERIKRQ